MKRFWKRMLALWMMICLLPVFSMAEEAKVTEYPPYPAALQISVAYEEWTSEDGRVTEVGIPVTCRRDVDKALRQVQQELWADALQHAEPTDTLEMIPTYRVSGTSWAGFLLTARVIRVIEVKGGNDYDETVYLTHRVLTYDMQTGTPLTLADVFPQDSAAWQMIAQEAEKQLRAYWPDQPRDESYIAGWCSAENLMQLSFLPCAGRLLVQAPLWPAIEGKNQLVPVNLYYPAYREYMTGAAFAQTDNSHRPIVAVTYDDGPSKFQTPRIRKHLASNGASATFFIIGKKMLGLADGVRTAMDYGHSVGSHTYDHVYEYQVGTGTLRENRLLSIETHLEKLGVEPLLFRAPGGHCEKYVEAEIGWPIILWSYSAGDTGNNTAPQLAKRIIEGSEDGDILLMHDIRDKTEEGSATFLKTMTEMGFMFATVEELLYLHGYTIEPNLVYHSAFTPVMTEGLV